MPRLLPQGNRGNDGCHHQALHRQRTEDQHRGQGAREAGGVGAAVGALRHAADPAARSGRCGKWPGPVEDEASGAASVRRFWLHRRADAAPLACSRPAKNPRLPLPRNFGLTSGSSWTTSSGSGGLDLGGSGTLSDSGYFVGGSSAAMVVIRTGRSALASSTWTFSGIGQGHWRSSPPSTVRWGRSPEERSQMGRGW